MGKEKGIELPRTNKRKRPKSRRPKAVDLPRREKRKTPTLLGFPKIDETEEEQES